MTVSEFTDLTLSLSMYYSHYYDDGDGSTADYVAIEVSDDNTNWVSVTGNQLTGAILELNGTNGPIDGDVGYGTSFENLSFDLSSYAGSANLIKVRIRFYGEWVDGVAVDDIKLFGNKLLGASFNFAAGINAYTDPNNPGGSQYTSGDVISVPLYVAPTLAQLELSDVFIFNAQASLNNGCTIDKEISITNNTKMWGSPSNSDWQTGSNWRPSGTPTADKCIIIRNTGTNPIISGGDDGEGLNLTIEDGATLTQQTNSTLTITESINVNAGGVYNMEDSSSLIQIDNVANTVDGTFTLQRTATIIENDYVYWSSPVASFPIENISPGTPNGFKYSWLPTVSTRLPGPLPDFVPNDYGDWQSANTGSMDLGKGYIVKGPTGFGSTINAFTATFSGTPNNGVITQSIERGTYMGGDYTYIPNGVATLTVTSDDDNWNLIGNPYPSALHLEDFLNHPANLNIDGTAYMWTHGTDIDISAINGQSFYDEFAYSYSGADYLAVNATGNSIPSPYEGYIGAGQGFFVLMLDTGASNQMVTFENTMRDFNYRNDQFYRDANPPDENEENKHRIWLDYINPSGATNTTLIGYIDGATNARDRLFDAKTTTGDGLNLYSLINEDTYIIQGRQTPFVASDEVPLGINITEAGIQTIAINALDGLFDYTDQDIFIEDATTGITHNLRNAPYMFNSDIGIIKDRFVLKYTANSLSTKDVDTLNGIKVFEENHEIVVKSDYEAIASIEVNDLLGRTLYNNPSINSKRFILSSMNPNDTALFLKIKLNNGRQKIVKLIF